MLLLAPLLVWPLACAVDKDEPEPDTNAPYAPDADDEFLVVVLPDTQIYAMSFPATFESQLRWIAENAEPLRIVFVSHVGDIVQTGTATNEWDVATAAFDWIQDIDLPHGFSVAGHDYSVGDGSVRDNSCANFTNLDCDFTDFLARFGPQHYADRGWYAGSSASGASSYQRVSAGGMDLLFLHMPQDPPRAEVEWAKEVLDANPGTLAHLTTHRHLYDYRLTADLPNPLDLLAPGRFNALTYLLGGQDLHFKTSLTADEVFTELVAAHPNIWGVHCGHVDAEFHQTSTNDAGLPVHEILVDFQDMADGGGGWLRVLKFRPSAKQVEVYTLSTLTGELRENGDGFDHSLDILTAYESAAIEEFEQLGMDTTEIQAYFDLVRDPSTPEHAAYRESLYAAGERDSRFVLDVDFPAYIAASR